MKRTLIWHLFPLVLVAGLLAACDESNDVYAFYTASGEDGASDLDGSEEEDAEDSSDSPLAPVEIRRLVPTSEDYSEPGNCVPGTKAIYQARVRWVGGNMVDLEFKKCNGEPIPAGTKYWIIAGVDEHPSGSGIEWNSSVRVEDVFETTSEVQGVWSVPVWRGPERVFSSPCGSVMRLTLVTDSSDFPLRRILYQYQATEFSIVCEEG